MRNSGRCPLALFVFGALGDMEGQDEEEGGGLSVPRVVVVIWLVVVVVIMAILRGGPWVEVWVEWMDDGMTRDVSLRYCCIVNQVR